MDREERKAWGPLIRAAREAQGLRQEDVAEQAGTTRRTLGSIERGDSVAQHEVLGRLLTVLGLAPRRLDGDVEAFLAMVGPLLQMLTGEQRLAVMPEITQLIAGHLGGDEGGANVTPIKPKPSSDPARTVRDIDKLVAKRSYDDRAGDPLDDGN